MDIGREPIRQPGSGSEKTHEPAQRGEENNEPRKTTGYSLEELSDLADRSRRELIGSDDSPKSKEAGSVGHSLSSRRARVEEVKKRLAEGFYDIPEIRNKIADKLADNMNP